METPKTKRRRPTAALAAGRRQQPRNMKPQSPDDREHQTSRSQILEATPTCPAKEADAASATTAATNGRWRRRENTHTRCHDMGAKWKGAPTESHYGRRPRGWVWHRPTSPTTGVTVANRAHSMPCRMCAFVLLTTFIFPGSYKMSKSAQTSDRRPSKETPYPLPGGKLSLGVDGHAR